MRIAHFNTHAEGGSAVLMLRLHRALCKAGEDSQVFHRKGRMQLSSAHCLEFNSGWRSRQWERIRQRLEVSLQLPNAASFFGRYRQYPPTPAPSPAPDIIHLHWVSQWLDLPSFVNSIPSHVPIVWTIHDMSPLAGGCFTDFGCKEFGKGCGLCPLLKFPFNQILARKELDRRAHSLRDRRVVVVGNSGFTTGLINKSNLFQKAEAVETIHPALDLEEFTRHDKTEARRLLGIAPDRFVIGFGAAVLTDENKGFDRFLAVAEEIAKRMGSVEALVFGEGVAAAARPNVNVRLLGRLSAPALQSLAYSAMDVFLLTSRMETFGQVATEAQACGTPVWAFDVGGLPDAVQNGVTGRLIPFPETQAMAESICAAKQDLPMMGARGFEWVRNQFALESMTDRYRALYRRALKV